MKKSRRANANLCPECRLRNPSDFLNRSHHKCAFPDEVFTEDNWDCETMNKLISLGGEAVYNDDQWSSTTPHDGMFVILGGYKRRARVEYAGNLNETTIEPLTLMRACEVIASLSTDP